MSGCLLLGVGSSAAGSGGVASVLAEGRLSSVLHGRICIEEPVTVQCMKMEWIASTMRQYVESLVSLGLSLIDTLII